MRTFRYIQLSLSLCLFPIKAQLSLFTPSGTEASVFRNGFSLYSNISDLVLLLPLPLFTYVLNNLGTNTPTSSPCQIVNGLKAIGPRS